jgi:hypothetical protein
MIKTMQTRGYDQLNHPPEISLPFQKSAIEKRPCRAREKTKRKIKREKNETARRVKPPCR